VSFVGRSSRALYGRWARFAESRTAAPLLFAWAVAEATVWPILPDALLAALMLARRTRRLWLLAACVAGMTLGGIATVLVAHWAPGFALDLLRDLPLMTEEQVRGAADGVRDHGAAGFLVQPVSGIPFKAWATMAGVQSLSPVLVIPAFIVARGLRMAATALLFGALARLLGPWLRDWFAVVAVLYVASFAFVFARIVL